MAAVVGFVARVVIRVTRGDKRYVMLYSTALDEHLKRLYEMGKRRVAVYVAASDPASNRIIMIKIIATIVKKGKRYYLYPTQEGQRFFVEYYNTLVIITRIEEL
jgi:hypothetical protein